MQFFNIVSTLGISIFFLIGCGASIPRIPVEGALAGQQIKTTVDAPIAEYYLEHYLRQDYTDATLDSIITRVHEDSDNTLPDRAYLRNLSETFSPDFATLYLAHRILAEEANARIQALYEQEFRKTRETLWKTGTFPAHPAASAYLFLFVPSWFYKSHPDNGGDLGLDHYLKDPEIDLKTAAFARAIIRYVEKRQICIREE